MQNYGTLKSFIADFLARDDLTSQIGTFITLTEQRMSRELDIALLERVARASVAQGQQFVSLPTDLRSIREVAYVDGDTRRALYYLSPAQLDERKRSTTTSELAYYSITANDLELLATPGKALTLEIVYNEGVAALTDSEPTNTVLARHGDCYLQGALHQAFAFLQDEQRAQYHDALFTRALAEIKKDSDRQRFGTADLQIRRGISDGGGSTGLVSTSSSTGGTTGATGPQGPAGADGADGLGWTGGSYDAGTGVVTFTSDDGLGFSTGDLRGSGSGSGISNVVEDTTPQLGGNLDLNSNDITGTGDIDLTGTITATSGGSVIPFYFANQAAFPNATTYHGAIAHSHADGTMYFAHGGAWERLAKYSEIGSGDITAVNITAGTGLTGSQNTASGDHNQTLALATAGIGSGTYGSTSNTTKIDTITVDAYGRVTAVATGAVSSGGSQASRSSASGSTGTINNNQTTNITITGFKGYGLYSIQTSHAAWVRLYVDTSSRTSDATRLQSVDPAPDAGVVAETITATGTTVNFGPAVMGYTSNASTSLPLAVTNLSGSSANITVTLSLLQLEA